MAKVAYVIDDKIKTKKKSPKKTKRYKFLVKETKPVYTPEKKNKSGKLYFQTDSIQIYNTDILKIDCLSEGTIDLIVTSPPYNVDIQYGSHDDKMTYEDYLNLGLD